MPKHNCPKCDNMNYVPPPPRPKTVKVRIGVVMNDFGEWVGTGWDGATDEAMKRQLEDICLPSANPSATYFIEAELPLPEPKTVQGRVT